MPDPRNLTSDEVRALQHQVGVLNRLVEISQAMNSTLQLNPLLDTIMEAATELTGSEGASILLVDNNTGDLHFTAATGEVSSELLGKVVPLDQSIAGAIISENRAMIVDDVHNEPRHYVSLDEAMAFQTRSLLGVPMRIHDRLIGVLEVVNKLEGEFQPEDMRSITILAAQAAIAIHNTWLVRSFEETSAELDKLNKLKSDFIAIASHELRTPLGIILGYAALLQESSTGITLDYATSLFKSALKMRTLVEGMTNLRYLQLEESEMQLEHVSLDDMMRSAYEEVLDLANAKNHLYVYEEMEEDLCVVADRSKAIMALINVLNNAVKFTPSGGAIILSAERHHNEGWVVVRDNGYGIPGEALERIFDQFYQVEDPLTRRHGGLGIGLTITRAVMGRHSGRVWAESPGPGEGSRFTLAFPLAEKSTP